MSHANGLNAITIRSWRSIQKIETEVPLGDEEKMSIELS
jgi:hypothetical protein